MAGLVMRQWSRARFVAAGGIVAAAITAFAIWGGSSPPSAAPLPYQIPAELQFFHATMARTVLASDDADAYIGYSCLQRPTGIYLAQIEKNPTTGGLEKTESFHSTSYSPTNVASREGGRELYVAGIQLMPGGDWSDVIEKWVFPEIQGTYVAAMSGPPTQRGVDRGPYTGTVYISGTTYLPISQRGPQHRPSPQRTLLYSGKTYQHIDAVEVDPEGRFLLFHSYSLKNLYSMDLMSPTLPIQVEFSVQQIPHLADVHSMGAFDHPTEGRFYRLSELNTQNKPGPTGAITVLLDPDNDGYFDSYQTLSYAQKKQGAWADQSAWHDLENYGWTWPAGW